jgi:hypothetical protein
MASADMDRLVARLKRSRSTIPVYEGGKLVGHYGLAWNREGTKQVLVFIPAGDVR